MAPYLHLLVMIDVQEALPEFDNFQGHKQGNGHQVRVQDPKSDHQDDPVHEPVLVVTLQDTYFLTPMGEQAVNDCTCLIKNASTNSSS